VNEQRRPAVFRLDDPHVALSEADTPLRARPGEIVIRPEPDAEALTDIVAPVAAKRRFRWGTLFWSALGGLVSMGASLAVWRLIEDLFARAEWLGWVGATLAALTALAFLVIVIREAIGLSRLAAVETLRERALAIVASDDRDAGRTLIGDLIAFARKSPRLSRGRVALEGHTHDIIDGADLVRLAERQLMPDLDAQARQLVADASKRVSVVTAVSPRAAIDMAFVFITALRMIRRLAELYGGRPGTLGMIRLVRQTITHLAVTGGMAAGDSIVQQMLGHGVAAKLSAKLGEGVLNGLLTARLGLAAIDVVRPLPFVALPRPSMTDVAGGIIRRKGEKDEPAA
jgi:putative membrane protein